ncbi:MAG: 50S ribosomal protein L25 [Deltaproteobacteria bacterium]|nr:50S ribosomal protein L25 [Deltaproteobacteria bacterium]
MEFIKLEALARESKGKSAARRMRKAGRVPAVVYGKDTDTRKISVDPEALIKALAGPLRVNTPLDVVISDVNSEKKEDALVIVKDHHYDPVTRELLHVDFLSISESAPIRVDVPVVKVGRSKGEQLGGILRMVHRTLPVICLPKDIPAKISVDVSALEGGITYHVSELPLAEGLTVAMPPQEAVLTISPIVIEEVAPEEPAAGKKKKK